VKGAAVKPLRSLSAASRQRMNSCPSPRSAAAAIAANSESAWLRAAGFRCSSYSSAMISQ
jgi:hypothetical protein